MPERSMAPSLADAVEVALRFATALTKRDYDAAYALTSSDYQNRSKGR